MIENLTKVKRSDKVLSVDIAATAHVILEGMTIISYVFF